MRTLARAAAAVALLAAVAVPARAVEGWTPSAWKDESTLQLRTAAPGEEPHWFPVWLVVIDGALYVRLGNRAARRVEHNASGMQLGIRVDDHEFRVTGVPAPDMAERVAAAMREKYWSDVFVRWISHPMTLRLEPAA
jgi:hypothetical protein